MHSPLLSLTGFSFQTFDLLQTLLLLLTLAFLIQTNPAVLDLNGLLLTDFAAQQLEVASALDLFGTIAVVLVP